MTIHNIYIFDRQGVLIFYGEWNRKKQSGMTRDEVGPTCVIENDPLLFHCKQREIQFPPPLHPLHSKGLPLDCWDSN